MSVEKMIHDMIEMLTDAMGDAVKHDKGNKVMEPESARLCSQPRPWLRPSVSRFRTIRTDYTATCSRERRSPLGIHA